MKILIISHEYPPIGGGGANACMFLARQYADKGHESVIVTVYYEGLEEDEYINDGETRVIRVRAKRTSKTHCSFPEMFDYLLKARPVLRDLCSHEKFDICHVFFGIPSGPLAYWLKKKYHIPYVIRFGGGDIPGFQNRFKILYKLIGVPLKTIWRKADGLVANSEGLKEFALNFFDECEIQIINNGVDSCAFAPEREADYSGEIKLLFVSRLIERKGLQFLIPRLSGISTELNRKLSLTIAGDGPYRETLESLALENDVGDMVTFLGQKDKSDLPEIYRQGNVFVFPSQREGMPNAVLEAMASGLPVLMMKNCEGSTELVGSNGILADEDICSALTEFLKLPVEKQQEMARESRKKAVEEFSWDSIGNQYIDLFSQIISKEKEKE